MKGILNEIIEHKRKEVEERKQQRPLASLQEMIEHVSPTRDFHQGLKRGNGPVKLLAEIKAASPSAGTIRSDFDAAEIAAIYQDCGASAISVLTDQKYFGGTDEHLQQAKEATQLPVLRKDFTIDEYQLYESRAIGADAILLMAQVLDEATYAHLYQRSRELGLHVLAEGHTASQIEFLVSIGAEVIGINNRDFKTMTVNIENTLRNRHIVPDGHVLVSQSGIFTREEVLKLENAGVDAIQVGTSIMQGDMKNQLKSLMGRE